MKIVSITRALLGLCAAVSIAFATVSCSDNGGGSDTPDHDHSDGADHDHDHSDGGDHDHSH